MEGRRLTASRALTQLEASAYVPAGLVGAPRIETLMRDLPASLNPVGIDTALCRVLDSAPLVDADRAEPERRRNPVSIPPPASPSGRGANPLGGATKRPPGSNRAMRSARHSPGRNRDVLPPARPAPLTGEPVLDQLNAPDEPARGGNPRVAAAPQPLIASEARFRRVAPVATNAGPVGPAAGRVDVRQLVRARMAEHGTPDWQSAAPAESEARRPLRNDDPVAGPAVGASAQPADSDLRARHQARAGRPATGLLDAEEAGTMGAPISRAAAVPRGADIPRPSSLRELADTWGRPDRSVARPGAGMSGTAFPQPADSSGDDHSGDDQGLAAGFRSHRAPQQDLAGFDLEAEALLLDIIERGLRSEARRYGLDLDGWGVQ